MDVRSGKVLYGEDADGLRYPASLTKMMTLYLVFEALEAGRIRLDSKVPVSANAASEPPSKLGVRAGGSVSVDQAIRALVTRSANDISTALAEFLGGSEARFAQMMTRKARALGMTRTTYRNAHGLPNGAQVTTARDQARLGIALRQHFPQYYGYFSIRNFRFGKQVIGSHNRLVGTVKGVDGIKTGYTAAAGSNLATSAQLDGRSIVAVVLGGRSSAARDATMRNLVAEYLPKASRRGSDMVVAMAAPVPVTPARPEPRQSTVAALDLPDAGPLPNARYDAAPAPVSAYAAAPAEKKVISGPAPTAVAALAAIPVPAPEFIPQRPARADDDAGIDAVTTASTRSARNMAKPSGWVIQIGASPDEKSALTLLEDAKGKGGNVLRSAQPFTVAINSNGASLYRARFGGFGDQRTAVDACNALKKKGISCWASLQ